MAKLPAFQFYPGDWQKDPDLKRCSHAAKGVWIDMLCLMFECDDRGVLATAGRAWTDEEIVQAVGGDRGVTAKCLRELVEKGVASRGNAGAVYSRRMVREEEVRRTKVENGSKGGSETQAKRVANRQANRVAKSGSSSSSSTSVSPLPPRGGASSRPLEGATPPNAPNAEAYRVIPLTADVAEKAKAAYAQRAADAKKEASK